MVTLSKQGRFGENDKTSILTEEMHEWMRKNGSSLIDMNTGHPRRKMPLEVQSEIIRAAQGTLDYLPPAGSDKGREVMAQYANYLVGIDGHFTGKDVVVTGNGTDAFVKLMLSTLEKGSKAICMPPFYGAYTKPILRTGAEIVRVTTSRDNRFTPTGAAVVSAWEPHAETATLLFGPTGNPTGATVSSDQAKDLAEGFNEINRRSGGKVTFVLDVVYHEITSGEDAQIYSFLDEGARRNTVLIMSASKIMGLTSMIGHIATKSPELAAAVERLRADWHLSAPTLVEPAYAAGLETIMREAEQVKRLEGTAFRHRGGDSHMERLASSYHEEMRLMQKGIETIAENYGVEPKEVFNYKADKALYIFPRLGKLFAGGKIPEDAVIFGDVKLRDFIGNDRITNDIEAEKLIYAMAGRSPGAHGIFARPGRVFGVDPAEGHIRLTCTSHGREGREKHNAALAVIDDAMQLLGIKKVKEKDHKIPIEREDDQHDLWQQMVEKSAKAAPYKGWGPTSYTSF